MTWLYVLSKVIVKLFGNSLEIISNSVGSNLY